MNCTLAYIGDISGSNYPLALYLIRARAEAEPALENSVHFSLEIFPHDVDPHRAAVDLMASSPDVIALSCYLWNIQSSLRLCDELKGMNPNLPIVLGGPQVTPLARYYLESSASADIVVVGEGEETFRDLLLALTEPGAGTPLLRSGVSDRLQSIPGLTYRAGGNVRRTPYRPPIADLSRIPNVFRDPDSDTITGHRGVLYETFRGCPYACSFCEWSEPGSKARLRFFPLERVLEDIPRILGASLREFFFIDSALNFHADRAKTILKTIERARRETGSRTMVGLHLEAERTDDEFCDLLARTEARTLVGLQTFGHSALIEANRRWFKQERFERGIERLRRHGVKIYNIQIIYGLPDDNFEQFRENVSWSIERGLRIWCGPLLLLPGTAYAARAPELEIVADPEPPYRVTSSRGYTSHDMTRSFHLATGIDFYNRLGPGAIREGARVLDLNEIDFLEKIGWWWSRANGESPESIPPANFPGLFTFVTDRLRECGSPEDPKEVIRRILDRAREEPHG